MNLNHINTLHNIDAESETHYAFHEQIDITQYPQVHDFYEILLIIQGALPYELCGISYLLQEGNMIFMRPGDVHSKFLTEKKCRHINLAFPSKTVDALFEYLYDDTQKYIFLSLPSVPIIHLSSNEKNILQSKLDRLNIIPLSDKKTMRTHLRMVLMEIMTLYISRTFVNSPTVPKDKKIPNWLWEMLLELDHPENFSNTLEDWSNKLNKSKEYICRNFQKYINTTPTKYFNSLRLNYAANLLTHTNIEIIDIAFESGFQSLSHFYHVFKKEFGTSPSIYRAGKTISTPK